MTTLYGIPNCDSCRKARAWLAARGKSYRFHDLRKDGLDTDRLQHWVDAVGWETLINRRGTTWRALPDADRTALDQSRDPARLLHWPTLIKRPVLTHGDLVLVGFSPELYDCIS